MYRCIFFLFLFVHCSDISSQTFFGYKGGISLSTLSSNTALFGKVTNKKILGANGGIFFDFKKKKKKMSFRVDLDFIQKGYERDETFVHIEYITVEMAYAKLSTLVKYNKKWNIIRGYVIAGPYFAGMLYGTKETGFITREKNRLIFDRNDGIDRLNRGDLGLVFGWGIGIPIRKNNLFFEYQYDLGIFDINLGKKYKHFNRTFSMSLGYTYILR